jgi:hypothetical protein
MRNEVKNLDIPEMMPLKYWGLVEEPLKGWFRMGGYRGLMACEESLFQRNRWTILLLAIIQFPQGMRLLAQEELPDA